MIGKTLAELKTAATSRRLQSPEHLCRVVELYTAGYSSEDHDLSAVVVMVGVTSGRIS